MKSRLLPIRLPWEGWIIFAGSLFRMAGLFRPLLGNFSGYQTSNAMMAQFFTEHHFANWLYPQVHILSAGKPGFLLLAYPLSSLVAGFLFSWFGGSLDAWGRFQAVLFFAGSSTYLYLLLKALTSPKVARAGLIAFCLFPLTIIYGQSFQNEMATVFFSLAFFFHLTQVIRRGGLLHLIASSISFSLVLVTRPNNLYLLAPAFYLAFTLNDQTTSRLKNFSRTLLVLGASLILPGLWYWHIWKVSYEANNIYSTLFQQLAVRSSFFSSLIFNPEYYRDLFDIVSGMVFTPIGFTLLVMSLFLSPLNHRIKIFFLLWGLSFLGSCMLIPRKLIDHEFYWLHFLIPASPLVGGAFVGLTDLIKEKKSEIAGAFTLFFVLISLVISLRYAVNPAFKTTAEDQPIPEIAQKVKELIPKQGSRLIAQGTIHLLYYADRYGWPFVIERSGEISDYYKYTNWEKLSEEQRKIRNEALKDPIRNLEYLRKYDGATHFVVTNPAEFYKAKEFSNYLYSHYPLLSEKKGTYVIFNLISNDI